MLMCWLLLFIAHVLFLNFHCFFFQFAINFHNKIKDYFHLSLYFYNLQIKIHNPLSEKHDQNISNIHIKMISTLLQLEDVFVVQPGPSVRSSDLSHFLPHSVHVVLLFVQLHAVVQLLQSPFVDVHIWLCPHSAPKLRLLLPPQLLKQNLVPFHAVSLHALGVFLELQQMLLIEIHSIVQCVQGLCC